jgi:hypothetical protein
MKKDHKRQMEISRIAYDDTPTQYALYTQICWQLEPTARFQAWVSV